MIKYDAGQTGLLFAIQWRGSVFPKAMLLAVPNAVLAVLLHLYCRSNVPNAPGTEVPPMSMEGVHWIYASYTSVLGFLVVFRNNQAHTRFWEGATLMNQIRGEWFNAISTLFAFCNHTDEFAGRVLHFQNTLLRLTSMLYSEALQQVCAIRDDSPEIIDSCGMDRDSMEFMKTSNDRCEIILQWIQRLIVDSEECNVIKIAPPLLTRAFQELSHGIVNLNNARKIKDIPFPFPYAQLITCMLVVHWMVTPLIASQVMTSTVFVGVMCFSVTFSFWCLIYIALEIDDPFGDDDNDLPLQEMQRDFNKSLLRLMSPLAQKVPHFEFALDEDASVIVARRFSLRERSMSRNSHTETHVTIARGVQPITSQCMKGLQELSTGSNCSAGLHTVHSDSVVDFSRPPTRHALHNGSVVGGGIHLETPKACIDAETRGLPGRTLDKEALQAPPTRVEPRPRATASSRPLGTPPSSPESLPLRLRTDSVRRGGEVRDVGRIPPGDTTTVSPSSSPEPTGQVSRRPHGCSRSLACHG